MRCTIFGSAIIALAVAAGVAGYLTASSSSAPRHGAVATRGTFVSLLRVCRLSSPRYRLLTGCVNGHYDLALEQFSLSDGRRIGTIASVPFGANAPAELPPAGTNDGTLLLTSASGSRCLHDGKPLKGVYAECQPSPNSCINTIMSLSPRNPTLARLLTVRSDQTIGAVVPSPDGSEVAYSARPCVGTSPPPGLYVRDLKSGVTREIVSAAYCSAIGQPAWNAAGTELAFRFRVSSGRPQPAPVGSSGPACPQPSNPAWHVVVTRATGRGRPRVLLPSHRGCSIDAVAFDAGSVIAAEGCSQPHRPVFASGATRGPAYVLRYDARGRIAVRIRLPYRGLDPEQTLIAGEPHSSRVLITQDQPTGLAARDDDHVYELGGTRLRQVVERSWGSDFIAVPW